MHARLWSPQEAAEILGVAVGTLTQWRTTRRVSLPYVKVGRHVRYKPEDVERFITARTVSGTADYQADRPAA